MRKNILPLIFLIIVGCKPNSSPSYEEIKAEQGRLQKLRAEIQQAQKLQERKERDQDAQEKKLKAERLLINKQREEAIAERQQTEKLRNEIKAVEQKAAKLRAENEARKKFPYKGVWVAANPDNVVMKGRNFTPINSIELTGNNLCYVNEREVSYRVSGDIILINERIKKIGICL